MTIEPRTLKGFRDYGPEEQSFREAAFAKIRIVFERFGFLPLSTPALEYKEILMGKYGEDEKLMYSFKDNGERDVALRYDLTVPLARYVAQNQNQLVLPFKRYQIAPVWRADNPQKGRLREFYQCDVDTVGTESPLADAEVMACLCKTLEALGIDDYELKINDRRIVSDFLRSLALDAKQEVEVLRAIDKLEKIGTTEVNKLLEEKGLGSIVKKLEGFLADNSLTPELSALMDQVKALGIAKVIFDKSMVRGLDYYTSTVFEIKLRDKPGFGSIAGGGRYDSLVDQFSENSLPAVGGSIGIDRLFDAMRELDLIKFENPLKVLVTNWGEEFLPTNLQIVTQLREAGVNTEFYYQATPKLDKQLKYAEKKGIPYVVIIGPDELASEAAQVKNLPKRSQEAVPMGQLVDYLKSN